MRASPGRRRACRPVRAGRQPGYDRQLEEWASKYDWRDRTFAFDVAEDRRDRARMNDRKAQMELAQEKIGRLGTELAMIRLTGGTYTAEDGTEFTVAPLDPNKLDPYRLGALLAEATRTWRLAHGQPIDFTKGIFMLSSRDVARIVEKIMEAAYDFWGTDERWALFVERVRSIPSAR